VTGLTEAELDAAAVRGFLQALGPKVELITTGATAATGEAPAISRVELFDESVLCVRVGRVQEGLADAVERVFQEVNASNKVSGLALDLRYAGGTDYAAAAAAADLFVTRTQPLLDWETGSAQAKNQGNEIGVPLAILVNRATTGAAEALAGALRSAGAGLILGGRTAGEALAMRDFELGNGRRLRIATGPVKLGDGTPLATNGVKPDIEVDISPADERVYYADAFHTATRNGGATNGARRVRFSEADLVREHRQGLGRGVEPAEPRLTEPQAPLVTDPALARAIDLLKGLAVVRQSRS
jgi:C-terminal processing protease CtpA/Prc